MKRYLFLLICTCLIAGLLTGQTQIISIEECYEKANANYPLIKRYTLIERSRDFDLSNAGKAYLPQLSFSGKASYQSEVTKIPITIPGMNIKGLSKDQYSATIDINQNIWDGGVTASKKDIIKATSTVDRSQLDVDIYSINDRINQIYFGILLLDARLKQNDLLQEELGRNFNLISSYIENGIANQSDLDAVKVEQLKTVQSKEQLLASRKSYIYMLSVFIGEDLDDSVILEIPRVEDFNIYQSVNRPELTFFDAQINRLEAQKKSIKTGYMPRIGLFLTGGYGRPGLNMLENDFSPYYIGGLRISWNLGSLYTQKNDMKLIEINQDNIRVQRETFLFNTGMEVGQEQIEIRKNRDILKYDDEIIRLRNNVKTATETKVANGMATITDLLRDVNAEDLARQDKIQHEMELLLSIYNLRFTTNN